tara:strand:- start:337 stop:786 length:450 start_codon:yes stop_codon:yes gene_type:complete
MPTYVFNCADHGNFDDLLSWDEYKANDQKLECPECGVKCEREYDGQVPNRVGVKKYTDDLASVNAKGKEGYEALINDTKEALKFDKGVSPYNKYNIPWDTLEKQGKVRKISQDQAKQKLENAKKTGDQVTSMMTKQDVDLTIKKDRLDG